ncbi:MAG TPA: ferritin-like domain-containing protein [Gaiellaceae bacterium]|nr:ferritin-like domain-containing protein [Gaiellaceae bacterium]
MSRAGFLRRGAVGSSAVLVSGFGLPALGLVGAASAATPPDADLAYLRLLIAAELLVLDFQSRALASGKLRRNGAHALFHRIRADESAHYTHLARLLTAAGQTPATSGDIDFSYPRGCFRSQASIVRLAGRLERLMVGAYVGATANVETPALRLPIGQIAANEAQHQGALAGLSGGAVVEKAFAPALQMGAVSNALDEFES